MNPYELEELRELYFKQNQYYSDSCKYSNAQYRPLVEVSENSYMNRLKMDLSLLEKSLNPDKQNYKTISEQVFGSQLKKEYVNLKHSANLLKERAQLYKNHVKEIDRRHIEIQEKLFGVQINHHADKARRLSNLESQLAQLEKERREEQSAFWKDTVDLRKELFEGANNYSDARHRTSVFADVEAGYGR